MPLFKVHFGDHTALMSTNGQKTKKKHFENKSRNIPPTILPPKKQEHKQIRKPQNKKGKTADNSAGDRQRWSASRECFVSSSVARFGGAPPSGPPQSEFWADVDFFQVPLFRRS